MQEQSLELRQNSGNFNQLTKICMYAIEVPVNSVKEPSLEFR